MTLMKTYGFPTFFFKNMFDEMEKLQRAMNKRPTAGVFPLINVTEDKDAFFVRAELPGMKTDELEINATSETLTIVGERKIPAEEGNVKYHRRERDAGKFSRILNMPRIIDTSKVEANLVDGILTIKLPKAESAKPRQIKIN